MHCVGGQPILRNNLISYPFQELMEVFRLWLVFEYSWLPPMWRFEKNRFLYSGLRVSKPKRNGARSSWTCTRRPTE